jgi:LacI family transcriptional regulator
MEGMPPKAPNLSRAGQPPRVALLIETSNAYARGVLAGIEDYILSHGPWSVYLGEHTRGDRPPDWVAKWDGDGIIARIENRRIAGVLAKVRVPVVDLSAFRFLAQTPTVTTDNAAIARMAVQHFTERGFRHFGYCGEARFAWSVARGEYFSLFVRGSGYLCHMYAAKDSQADSDAETEGLAQWLKESEESGVR